MKKICFIGFLSVLFVSASFAQPKIGVTAGLNASKLNVSGEGAPSFNFKAGFQAGVIADFAITENFSIMPELLFGQRGTKYKESTVEKGIPVDATVSMTLNYLQLPVNAAYKFDVGSGSKVFVFAGPYFGYGLSSKAKAKAKAQGTEISVPMNDQFKFGSGVDEIKPFDFGLNVGVGYMYEKVFFKLQYNQGLINMNNDSDGTVKNMNLAVTVGYFFN